MPLGIAIAEFMMLLDILITILVSAVAFTVAVFVFRKRIASLTAVRRMTLGAPSPSGGAAAAGVTAPPVQEGDLGVAHTPLRPGGKARFGDHFVDVLTEGDFVNRGCAVRVIRICGHQVFVAQSRDV